MVRMFSVNQARAKEKYHLKDSTKQEGRESGIWLISALSVSLKALTKLTIGGYSGCKSYPTAYNKDVG
jgi:hypothetical protein